MIWSRKNSS